MARLNYHEGSNAEIRKLAKEAKEVVHTAVRSQEVAWLIENDLPDEAAALRRWAASRMVTFEEIALTVSALQAVCHHSWDDHRYSSCLICGRWKD